MRGNRQHPSVKIVTRSRLWIRAAVLAILGTLVLSASAIAAEPPAGAGATPGLSLEVAAGEPVAGEAPATGQTPAPGQEAPQAEPVVVQEAPPVEQAPVQETPPAESIPAPPETPPAESAVAPPETPAESTPAPVQETPPLQPIVERSQETTTLAPVGEHQAEGFVPSVPLAAVSGASAGPSPPASPEFSDAVIGATAIGAADGVESAATAAAAPTTVSILAQLSPAQRAGDLRCQLSGLSGPMTQNCTASWLGSTSVLAAYRLENAAATVTAAGAPGGGSGGGSSGGGDGVGGSHPLAPPGGTAPSGAFGGASGGGSGIALSGFFTLAGLLLLAAPRALRRLRLSCRPWLTAFFVLIPERPG